MGMTTEDLTKTSDADLLYFYKRAVELKGEGPHDIAQLLDEILKRMSTATADLKESK